MGTSNEKKKNLRQDKRQAQTDLITPGTVQKYIPNKAPIASPASPPLALLIEAIAEKISGAPFPNARNVTP